MKHKRLLSMLLALIMVLSLLPVSALAAVGEEPVEGQVTAVKSLVTDDNGEPVVDTDGNYTVQISIQGNPVTQTTGSAADVVLVVDNSGSMDSSVGIPCTAKKETFVSVGTEEFSIFGVGVVWETFECPDCHANYVKCTGKSTEWEIYDQRPNVCTGEVGNVVRIKAAKEVSKEFAEAILADGTNNQLAVIGFAHRNDKGGADDTDAIKVAHGLTDDPANVNDAIEKMQAKGGTNYSAALQQAYNYLNARTDKSRPAYVVFISDGAPGYSGESLNDKKWNGAEQITALKNAGVTVYTVGIALDTDPANYLKNMASDVKDEHFINVTGTDYKDQLAEILAKWAIQINKAPAGTDAKIVDVIKTDHVTFVGSQSENLVYNAADNTLTWNIGNIPAEEAVATFKVKPVDGKYGTLYTNESITLTYTDKDGESVTVYDDFQDKNIEIGNPTISIPEPPAPETVTVTFDAKGGAWDENADLNGYTKGTSDGNNIAQKTMEKGSALTKPDDPAREDFVFKGWIYEGVDVAFVGQPVNADITLVAKWERAPVVQLTYKTQQHFIDADGQEHLTINVQTFTADEGTAISTLIAGIAKNQMQDGIDYIYAPAETKLNGAVLADDATLTADNSIIDLYYYADSWTDADLTDDPEDFDSTSTGDGIPDCQQAVIQFQTGDPNGTVTGRDAVIQVFTLEKNNAGAYAGTILKDEIKQPDVTSKDSFVFYMWTVDDGETSVNPFVDTAVVGGQVITYYAHFTVPGLSVVKTVESITRPDGTVRAEGEKADTGDTIVWKIEVENTGKVELRVSFEDTIKDAAGETFLYQLGTFTGNKSEVKTALIMAGTTQTFYAEYTVLEADKGKTLTNTVTVSDPDKNVTGTDEAPGVEVEPVPPTTPPALNRADHYAYIIGYPDGTARPEGDITRAEVATIFFRLLEDEVRDSNLTKENSFSDVSAGDWYCTAVSTMAKLGIVTGYPDGTFRPNEAITRAELAAIAARFDDSKVISSDFSDMSGHWAEALVERAAALGWVNGYPDGTFKPDQDITRAEAMTLINNVLDRIPETAADLRDDMHVWPDNAKDAWYYIAVQEATVSHEYVRKSGSDFERWTALRNDPDWSRYNG